MAIRLWWQQKAFLGSTGTFQGEGGPSLSPLFRPFSGNCSSNSFRLIWTWKGNTWVCSCKIRPANSKKTPPGTPKHTQGFPGNSPLRDGALSDDWAPFLPPKEFRALSSEMTAAARFIAKLFFPWADGWMSFLFPMRKTCLDLLF